MNESVFTAFIDRVEGDTAVLLVTDELHEVCLPKSVLPHEAREGSVLVIRIELDETAARDARERIARLIRKLEK